MSLIKRREFLKHSAAAALGLTALSKSRVMGANEDIRVGIIGIGRKGPEHANHIGSIPGARLVALADPDPGYHMGDFKEELSRRENPVQVDIHTDFRQMLDRKDIDAVIISSCNHWHVLHGIYALNAGKHIYIEKPMSHDIWQGRQLVNLAAKKTNLVAYPGHQHRSRNCWPEIMQYLKEDRLGKVKCVRGLCFRERTSIGKRDVPLTPPASCNYDLWLGPSEDLPIVRSEFHYDWHWVWNTGNGEIGNQGVHQIDIGRWLLGQQGYPEQVLSIGGRFRDKDAGQTPNTHIIFYDYKPVPLIFEIRALPVEPEIRAMPIYKGIRVGNIVECEGGYISEETAYDNDGKRIHQFAGHGAENHLPRFFEMIRNHSQSGMPCSMEDSQIASAMCHLANISNRTGTQASPAEVVHKIQKDTLKSETWRRMLEHLVVNEIDLNKDPITLGALLTFDGNNERFTGPQAEQANALLKQEYRNHWAIPQIS